MCVVVYTFLFYKESNHQSIQFYPWCIVLFFLWNFSHMMNASDVSSSRICKLANTKFHHLCWKWMFSIFLYQIFDKLFSNKNCSLKGNTNIKNHSVSVGSAATHIQAYWLPILSNVSSIINSDTFRLFCNIFIGL